MRARGYQVHLTKRVFQFHSCKMVVIVKGEPFVVEKFLNDERFSALRINASILGHVLGRSLGQVYYNKESLITSPQIRFVDIKARNLIYIVLMLDNWDKTFYTDCLNAYTNKV